MSALQTPSTVLRAAADLLAKPGAWTQGALARGATRRPTMALSKRAVCWCAKGAMAAVSWYGETYFAALGALEVVAGDSIVDWNDTPGRTQEEVVAAFHKAADLAEKRP